jgi:hypothetical protein
MTEIQKRMRDFLSSARLQIDEERNQKGVGRVSLTRTRRNRKIGSWLARYGVVSFIDWRQL